MDTNDSRYAQFLSILKEELLPAMGCTEPIAIAYASAKAKDVLGTMPERMTVEVSGNIVKNVKSVVVPHTGGLRGIKAAAAAGAAAGDADAELEVISDVTQEQIEEIKRYLEEIEIEVVRVDRGHIFDLGVRSFAGEDSAYVRIIDYHINIVEIERNGEVLLLKREEMQDDDLTDRSVLTIRDIIDFADSVDPEDVRELFQRQIDYNMAIAEEGLRGDYGANIGKVLLTNHEDDLSYKMKAYAAAASDARMNGCELPVVINSGSGNQGITASVPVIVYAQEKEKPFEGLRSAQDCSVWKCTNTEMNFSAATGS